MTKPFLPLVLLLPLAFPVQAEGLHAQVDRTRLSLGETLELTLETDDATVFGKPDFAPLETLFVVSPPRQINRLDSVGGLPRAVTRWTLTLQPRQAGQLTIPPLALGERYSEPIGLDVSEGNAPSTAAQAPVFVEASLDHDEVYVQAQVLLTLRIHHSVSLYDDSNLSPLQMADAHVERLGEPRTYEKTLNGVRHGVIEVRYALYPQRSGVLTLPSQTFSATSVAQSDGALSGARPGRALQAQSPPLTLRVRPRPASYPADAPWLPATAVTLEETWNPAPEQARAGESLTRTRRLKAEGLSAAQLPPLPDTEAAGLRVYPDQPTQHSATTVTGVTGLREQREALVPDQPGTLALPPVEVVWWNTREDRLERAALPARRLAVAENPALLESVSASPLHPTEGGPPLWPWQASTGLLACTTLLGFALWWRARHQPAIPRTGSGPSTRSLLDDLRRACQANDTQATRQALDAWARQQPETLADMAARYVPLSDALDGLNGALYSESGQLWQGDALWQAVSSLPPARPAEAAQDSGGLPPLYPR